MKTNERRQFGRRRANLHAFIVVESKPRIACRVRNIADEGALLEVEARAPLPPYFKLVVEADKFEADCEIRHQTDHGIGVYFQKVRIGRNGRDSRNVGVTNDISRSKPIVPQSA